MWVYESASLRLLAVNQMLLQYGCTEAEALQLTLLDLFRFRRERAHRHMPRPQKVGMCPHCASSCARKAACLTQK
jgi:hypothetical protein